MANRLPNGYDLPQPPCIPHRENNDWMEPGTEKQLLAVFAGLHLTLVLLHYRGY